MNLQLLQYAPPVFVYYDTLNDWLFTDWHGDLTLAQVQEGCLAIAECFLRHPTTRVLNSNCEVSSMSADVPAWLARQYLPSLRLAGVEQMAWVYGPAPLLQRYVEEALHPVEGSAVALFNNLADAYDWLQRSQFHHLAPQESRGSAAARQAELTRRVANLSAELQHYQQLAGLGA